MVSYKDIVEHISLMLGCLEKYVAIRNGQGDCGINVACENLVLCMLNKVYGFRLENYNSKSQVSNAAGIDLIDMDSKVCVQVTSTTTQKKLNDTLEKVKGNEKLKGYRLIFFALKNDCQNLYGKKDEDLRFDGAEDVIDFRRFLYRVENLEVKSVLDELDSTISGWLGCSYYVPDDFVLAMDEENRPRAEMFDLSDYYPRTVSLPWREDRWVEQYMHPERYRSRALSDFVNGRVPELCGNYWLLIAAGQTGKTYEAKKLTVDLQQTDGVFPVFLQVKHFSAQSDFFNLPFWWKPEHVVLILDGVDEISGRENRRLFMDSVDRLTAEQPDLRVVMTCRRNYIVDKSYEKFQRLRLDEMDGKEIENIVLHSSLSYPQDFLRLIEKNGLYGMGHVPFYLKAMMAHFEKEGTLGDSKLDLYRFLIEESFQGDMAKEKGQLISMQALAKQRLRKIAWVMQLCDRRNLKEEELCTYFNLGEVELETCLRYTIFFRDEQRNYAFEKDAFRMYYVVESLKDKNFEQILRHISYTGNGVERIKPEWYDILELLLSSLPNQGECRRALLKWTLQHHCEALLHVDAQSLDTTYRGKVFKKILLDYKKKQIVSNPDMGLGFERNLATFCTTAEALDFFIGEFKSAKEIGPYFYLLSFLLWFIDDKAIRLNEVERKIKRLVYRNLERWQDTDSKWYEGVYVPFENKIFANRKDIRKLMEYTANRLDIPLEKVIFHLLKTADVCDTFVDYTLAHEAEVHDYQNPRYPATVSVNRDCVVFALTHLKKSESLQKVWAYMPVYLEAPHHEEEKMRVVKQLLQRTGRVLKRKPELAETVEQVWVDISLNGHFTSEHLREILGDFRMLLLDARSCDVERVMEEAYDFLKQGPKRFTKWLGLHARLSLYLTPEDVDRWGAAWDAEDVVRKQLMKLLQNSFVPEVVDRVTYWMGHKFGLDKTVDQPAWTLSQKKERELEIMFEQPLFKAFVTEVMEKYGACEVDLLWENVKRDHPEMVNGELRSWLSNFYIDEKKVYDVTELLTSLEDAVYTHSRIVGLFGRELETAWTDEQLACMRKAVQSLLSSKITNESLIRLCLRLVMKYHIDLEERMMLKYLQYGGVYHTVNDRGTSPIYWVDYVTKRVAREKLSAKLAGLLRKKNWANEQLNDLEKLVGCAVHLQVVDTYPFICQHMMSVPYNKLLYADKLLREDPHNGWVALRRHFDKFTPDIQWFVLKQLAHIAEFEAEAKDYLLKYRPTWDDELQREALSVLLLLGEENALAECVQLLCNQTVSLHWMSYAPVLNYTDIRFLPQLMDLMRLTWNRTEFVDYWNSRIEDALTKMASCSIDQFEAVKKAILSLIAEDAKYSRLNYFIKVLEKHDPRIKKGPMGLREALLLIEKEDF